MLGGAEAFESNACPFIQIGLPAQGFLSTQTVDRCVKPFFPETISFLSDDIFCNL